jgi:ATP-dependent HslUV protease, peptidase subunit HslV
MLAAIGSGGPFATRLGHGSDANTKLSRERFVEKAMTIAGRICIYTNEKFIYSRSWS